MRNVILLTSFFLLTAYKVILILIEGGTLWVAFGWMLAGLWFFWIAWAYLKNKDLPAAGAFRYEASENQVARLAYFLVMTGLFLFVTLGT